MSTINIQGTIIDFPNSGTDPNWADAVDQFAVAVEEALSGITGASDISPTQFDISSYNTASNQSITGFQFSTATVRGFLARYTVYRSTTTDNYSETGILQAAYNSNNSVGQKWEMSREYVSTGSTNQGSITFSISDTGQIQFTTTALSGASHSGKIAFAAQALLQS